MIVCDLRTLDPDALAFRRKALRDAVICVGWLKLLSVICYVLLYFLVHGNSNGHISTVIQIMTLALIPFIILNGVVLFLGALEEKTFALEIGLWLCLTIASYNTVLGVMGGIYFIRTGYLTMHFMLAVIFAMLSVSLCTYCSPLLDIGLSKFAPNIAFVRNPHPDYCYARSCAAVLCHDVLIIYAYKSLLRSLRS